MSLPALSLVVAEPDPVTVHAPEGTWLDAAALAEATKLSKVAILKAFARAREGQPWRGSALELRENRGRGGVRLEVEAGSLPDAIQATLFRQSGGQTAKEKRVVRTEQSSQNERAGRRSRRSASSAAADPEALWAAWESAAPGSRELAQQRHRAVATFHQLARSLPRTRAAEATALECGLSLATLYGHLRTVRRLPPNLWLPALLPQYAGRTRTARFDLEAWLLIKNDYLRAEAPALTACVDRARRHSRKQGLDWAIPSTKTVQRRIDREIPGPVQVLAREGLEALERLYPAQERDHAFYGSLEAVNADGHRFDVFVRWEDGTVGRPVMVAFQDIRSGKFLSHRVDQTEHTDLVRLAYGDLVETFGIPEHAYLDNGRGFASKWMTGGTSTRFRFKVKAEEPTGIFVQMGTQVHWCTPYHGQAKPIERAFRDLCEYVAKHPALSGAYTGSNPNAKPENYGSKAIPIALFLRVLDEEIAAHNARQGRRSKVCAGRSLDEAFLEDYQRRERDGQLRMPTEAQRRLWLLTSEAVTASRENGEVSYEGNRYWAEPLVDHRGAKVVIRFDPERLHDTVWVYTLGGTFITPAACIRAAGFGDTTAAREHQRARAQYKRAAKAQLAAQRQIDRLEGLVPEPGEPATPVAKHPSSLTASQPGSLSEGDDFDADAAFAAAAHRLAIND